MIKYFKYILKKDYKTLFSSALLLIFLILFTCFLNKEHNNKPIFASLIIFSMGYVFFIAYRCIALLTKDLYSNEKYFTFTLPISKVGIAFGKYLYALLYIIVMQISILIIIFLTSYNRMMASNVDIKNHIIIPSLTFITFFILLYSVYYVLLVTGKILLKNEKIAKAFAVTLSIVIISIIINIVTNLLFDRPYNPEVYRLAYIILTLVYTITSIILTGISGILLEKYLDA